MLEMRKQASPWFMETTALVIQWISLISLHQESQTLFCSLVWSMKFKLRLSPSDLNSKTWMFRVNSL